MTENVGYTREPANRNVPDINLILREEQVDITKEKVITGDVNIHKEIYTKEKTIKVPLTYEELVIEKNETNGETETIRIPISEERIEVVKHRTELAEVSIYNQQYQTIEHVESTIKKEQLKTETIGNVKVNAQNDLEHFLKN